MATASDCSCACPTPEIVTVPGTAGTDGAAGAAGADGLNAYTVTTVPFSLPGTGPNPVAGAVSVGISSWAALGQIIFISNGTGGGTFSGHFQVLTEPSATTFTLQWLNYPNDSAAGSTFPAGCQVSPAGIIFKATPLPTALTNNTTGVAQATLDAGVGCSTITIPLTSLATGLGALAIDLLTNYVLGYAFKLLKFDFVTTVVGAGAGASQVFNLAIGGVAVTNTLTVNLASTNIIGAISLGAPSPIVAANTGNSTATLSIKMAAGGTVFTGGAGYFVIKVQNMDDANAAASLNASVTSLITALT